MALRRPARLTETIFTLSLSNNQASGSSHRLPACLPCQEPLYKWPALNRGTRCCNYTTRQFHSEGSRHESFQNSHGLRPRRRHTPLGPEDALKAVHKQDQASRSRQPSNRQQNLSRSKISKSASIDAPAWKSKDKDRSPRPPPRTATFQRPTTSHDSDSKFSPAQDKSDDKSWQAQKAALKEKFGDHGWAPRKKLSPEDMDKVRDLHAQDPTLYSTANLAEDFKVSPEAIRRILKSKWKPSPEEAEQRKQRWARRGERIYDHMASLGLRPPKGGPEK